LPQRRREIQFLVAALLHSKDDPPALPPSAVSAAQPLSPHPVGYPTIEHEEVAWLFDADGQRRLLPRRSEHCIGTYPVERWNECISQGPLGADGRAGVLRRLDRNSADFGERVR